jgi:hypothetical protein
VVLGVALFIPAASYATLLMELPGVTPRHVSLMMGTMISFCYVISAFAPTLVGAFRDRTGSFVPGFVAVTVFSWVILGHGAKVTVTAVAPLLGGSDLVLGGIYSGQVDLGQGSFPCPRLGIRSPHLPRPAPVLIAAALRDGPHRPAVEARRDSSGSTPSRRGSRR